MANTIANVQIQTFEANVRFLAQQGEALLANWVQQASHDSVSHNFERLGTIAMSAKSGRATASPVNDAPWSRRQSVISHFHAGDLVEAEDPAQMLVDPTSNIVQALGKAARRQIDKSIITAATASSRDGAGSAVTFVAGQILGDYSTEISFDFVSQVYELFMANNIPADEEKVFVIAPKQLRKLQQLVEYTSSDYVNVKALAERGYAPNWMGFTWIVSNQLGLASTNRDCFAMTRKAIGLHWAKNIWAKVAEDPSRSFAWQVYTAMSLGAVRVEDEQLVWCKLKETVT
jgi:hypothetical protein